MRTQTVSYAVRLTLDRARQIARPDADRKGKSFFVKSKSDWGVGRNQIVSVGGASFQNVYVAFNLYISHKKFFFPQIIINIQRFIIINKRKSVTLGNYI